MARPLPLLLTPVQDGFSFRADWGAVLRRVYQNMNDNRLLALAGGVVFYGLLAIFPAITATAQVVLNAIQAAEKADNVD